MGRNRIAELEGRVAALEQALAAAGLSIPDTIPPPRDYEMRDRIGPVAARMMLEAGTTTHTAIARRVKGFATSQDVTQVMNWMIQGGEVLRTITQPEGGGRPSIGYRLRLAKFPDPA